MLALTPSRTICPDAGIGRCFQRLFQWPASLQSPPKTAHLDTRVGKGHGARQRHDFSAIGDVVVVALVMVLLALGGPIAVTGLIVAVVFSSLDGVGGGWLPPHVFQERREVAPSLANGDASTAVSCVALDLRIGTPLVHVRPSSVFWGRMLSVPVVALSRLLSSKAAAGLASTIAQTESVRNGRAPAVALAVPAGVSVLVALGLRHNQEARESLTRKVFERLWSAQEFYPISVRVPNASVCQKISGGTRDAIHK
jgi:hypothetical protein